MATPLTVSCCNALELSCYIHPPAYYTSDDEIEEEEGDIDQPFTPQGSAPTSRHASAKRPSERSRSKSGSTASRRPSRGSSASTLLETPEPNLQESKLVFRSQESQVDLRKRDKNFLHFYNKVFFIISICSVTL